MYRKSHLLLKKKVYSLYFESNNDKLIALISVILIRSDFLIFISLNALKINVNLFLMSFEKFISKLFSFNLFLVIDLRDYIIIINKVIDKNERFFDVNILLLLYLYRLKINNILSFLILKIISYLFIYNFSKVKLCYFN